MQLANSFIAANSVEQEYLACSSSQHRKKFAQFFTPPEVADFMAKWLLTHPQLKKILEPAYGLGIFSRCLLQHKPNLIIKGFETDAIIFAKAAALFANHKNITLQLQDYMRCDWENKYDGIICNPPYFKFHDYDNKNIIKQLEDKISCKLNGFSNLYALFLLKSISQLNENGRAAYLVPSEFLNSDYGKLIKAQLINSQTLRHIIIIHFSETVFTQALTTACILLLANDKQSETVQFHTINSIADTQHLEKIISFYPKYLTQSLVFSFNELNSEIKWRAYYQPQNALKYKNLVPFSNYAKTMRGIATGANQYFIFNQSKANELHIPNDYLLPCICKSCDVKQAFFTQEHFDLLKSSDKNTFLLNSANALNSDSKAVKNYLTFGEQQGIDKKFLTASRKPWHALEKRPPAPIWVSVFNRTGLKFIRNEAGIANLTTFHGIYPNSENASPEKIALLFAYLLTDIAKKLFADNRREYGNGLEKFEPNDINKAQMLNLNDLEEPVKQDILKHYYLYRKSVLENTPNQSLIDYINKILTVQFS
jgi:adenine-specific DNA-methyltransferase